MSNINRIPPDQSTQVQRIEYRAIQYQELPQLHRAEPQQSKQSQKPERRHRPSHSYHVGDDFRSIKGFKVVFGNDSYTVPPGVVFTIKEVNKPRVTDHNFPELNETMYMILCRVLAHTGEYHDQGPIITEPVHRSLLIMAQKQDPAANTAKIEMGDLVNLARDQVFPVEENGQVTLRPLTAGAVLLIESRSTDVKKTLLSKLVPRGIEETLTQSPKDAQYFVRLAVPIMKPRSSVGYLPHSWLRPAA